MIVSTPLSVVKMPWHQVAIDQMKLIIFSYLTVACHHPGGPRGAFSMRVSKLVWDVRFLVIVNINIIKISVSITVNITKTYKKYRY